MQIASRRRWRSKRSSATYPLDWTIAIPKLGVRLDVRALVDDQELVTRASTGVTYWEGAVSVAGSFRNVAVRGEGYVEMTGYDRAFRAP
jgi:predicted secreted hydrolase